MIRRCLLLLIATLSLASAAQANPRCLSECTPRIGIVSAFGQEADLLLAQTKNRQRFDVNGNRFTTGTLRGNRVVIVLSGVSMVNAAMVTQLMLDHFRIERLVMSGIAGGVNPALNVGDVVVPDRWVQPLEVYWNRDASVPAPCGKPGDLACLGLQSAAPAGQTPPPFDAADPPGAFFLRDNFVRNATGASFKFDFPVDAAMLEVARRLRPALERCGPMARKPEGLDASLCVRTLPRLLVGGRGASAGVFLANPSYREYLFEVLQVQLFDMETAALAQVAHANRVPYIAFRSVSDLAGAEEFNADVGALFTSGLAEHNEAAVTLAFLEAWGRRSARR
jgi:adenosylhomocysteine nucleosidase